MKNNTTFTIECTMNERWANQFISMLKYMENLGELGGSRTVSLYSDGDGDFRPKFVINKAEYQIVSPLTDEDGNRFYDAG